MESEHSTQRTALHGIILWILAIGLIIGGYYLSIERYLDQNWLSRAGCLIVILGIWSGLGGLIELKLLNKARTIRKNISEHHIRQAYGADEEQLESELLKLNEEHLSRLNELQNELGVSIGFIEASLLVTGTLLWGFGDLLKYL